MQWTLQTYEMKKLLIFSPLMPCGICLYTPREHYTGSRACPLLLLMFILQNDLIHTFRNIRGSFTWCVNSLKNKNILNKRKTATITTFKLKIIPSRWSFCCNQNPWSSVLIPWLYHKYYCNCLILLSLISYILHQFQRLPTCRLLQTLKRSTPCDSLGLKYRMIELSPSWSFVRNDLVALVPSKSPIIVVSVVKGHNSLTQIQEPFQLGPHV